LDSPTAVAALFAAGCGGAAWLFWRHVWFFRNPPRHPPAAPGVVSAADGTVVYVRKVEPDEAVVSIKQGLAARLVDLVREDLAAPKLVVGVFMSPFDVHYNRSPIDGTVEFVRHYPGRNVHMGPMHWRVLLGRRPYYEGSAHIVQNERTVTKLNGRLRDAELACYVVQIAAKTVAGIEAYVRTGEAVRRGQVFGMIRIGSQVDIVLPWREDLNVRARVGQRVRAGETILVD
jgi:phosphatidylserine decarboxylase